jgi:hypothetical protein
MVEINKEILSEGEKEAANNLRLISLSQSEPKLYKKACRVCHGDITEELVLRIGSSLMGSKTQSYYVNEGYYCKSCGIKYEFIPEKSDT